MTTLEYAEQPLEFAYLAAKCMTFCDTQISILRDVASRCGKSGTPEDRVTALAILDEARSLQLRLIEHNHPDFISDYASFALDYVALGQKDLALDVITDSIQVAGDLRLQYRVGTLVAVADVCHQIGERGRCMELLDAITPYVQGRKIFRSVVDRFAATLVSLYLKLGMVESAQSVADKMTGFEKVNAMARIALYDRQPELCLDPGIDVAVNSATEKRYEYSLALVAGLMTENGLYGRARSVIDGIKTSYIWTEAMLDLTIRMFGGDESAGAVEVLDQVMSATTRLYYHAEQLGRLIPLLPPSHLDVAGAIAGRIRVEANEERKKRDRLLKLTRTVGLLALYSPAEAEEVMDLILKARLGDLKRRIGKFKTSSNRYSASILYELAMTIDEQGLGWDDRRRDLFRHHLTALQEHSRRNIFR